MLGPAKTYILRGTPRTYAIKAGLSPTIRQLKSAPVRGTEGAHKGNRWRRKGNRGPCNRNRAPFQLHEALLIACVPVTVLIVGVRADL